MKRIIALICLCTMLCTALVSCTIGNNETETEPAEEVETSYFQTDDVDTTRLRLVEKGLPKYQIVYASGAALSVVSAVNSLNSQIKKQTGTPLPVVKDDEETDSALGILLFGDTRYALSNQAVAKLTSGQFSISGDENFLVFARNGGKPTCFATYLKEQEKTTLQTHKDGTKTLYVDAYTSPNPEDIKLNGFDLKNYIIIYNDDHEGYATWADKLADAITSITHETTTVKAYSQVNSTVYPHEILIGLTGRDFSKQIYKNNPKAIMKGALMIQGDHVQVYCGGVWSAKAVVESFITSLKSHEIQNYSDGKYFEKNLITNTAHVERSTGSNLRLMSCNLLAETWAEDAYKNPSTDQHVNFWARAEIFMGTLTNWLPDACGLQETYTEWMKAFKYYLPILKEYYGVEYSRLFEKFGNKVNMTSILYRSDLYDVGASEAVNYSYANTLVSYQLRCMTWAVFTSKTDTTKQFILLNTHWPHGKDSQEDHDLSVSEEAAKVNALVKNYGVPVFCTGDFNNKNAAYPTDAFNTYIPFMQQSGVEDLWKQAQDASVLYNNLGGWGYLGKDHAASTYCDHILGRGNYTTNLYMTILGNDTKWTSDHSHMLADVTLK